MPTVIVPDITVTLEHVTCSGCGLNFAADKRWVDARREDHKSFACPNRCSLSFGGPSKAEQEAANLKKLLESEQSYAAEIHARWQQERTQHSATKGQLTKTRKRAAAALCPCCNRSFVQLRRHLASKHPDYDPAA